MVKAKYEKLTQGRIRLAKPILITTPSPSYMALNSISMVEIIITPDKSR